MSRARLRRGGLAAALGLVACRPESTATPVEPAPPPAPTAEDDAPAATAAEPRDTTFAFADFGSGDLGGLAGRKGAWLLWAMPPLELDDDNERWSVGGAIEGSTEREGAIPVTREQVRQIEGVSEPPTRVWLVGPDGPCEAEVAISGQANFYVVGSETVEIAFELSGCKGTDWAPVAVVGVEPPAALKWVRPTQTYNYGDGPTADATASLVEHVRREVPEHDAKVDATDPVLVGEVIEIVGSQPRIAQTLSGVEWEEPAEGDEEVCGTNAYWTIRTGVVVDGEIFEPPQPKDFVSRFDVLQLHGALVEGERALAIVYEESFSLVVFAPTQPDAKAGTWHRLPTGQYHDEDLAARREILGGGCDP